MFGLVCQHTRFVSLVGPLAGMHGVFAHVVGDLYSCVGFALLSGPVKCVCFMQVPLLPWFEGLAHDCAQLAASVLLLGFAPCMPPFFFLPAWFHHHRRGLCDGCRARAYVATVFGGGGCSGLRCVPWVCCCISVSHSQPLVCGKAEVLSDIWTFHAHSLGC